MNQHNYLNDLDAFDKICGDCCGLDVNEITTDDVRTQGKIYGIDIEWIAAALRGLKEYQKQTEV